MLADWKIHRYYWSITVTITEVNLQKKLQITIAGLKIPHYLKPKGQAQSQSSSRSQIQKLPTHLMNHYIHKRNPNPE